MLEPLAAPDALRPVGHFFPGRSARWVCDTCRAGRIPRAVKIGGAWFIRPSDIDRLVSGTSSGALTEEDAMADLRRRGIL